MMDSITREHIKSDTNDYLPRFALNSSYDDIDFTIKSSFVRKLFDLVNAESDDVVGFLQDGSCFEVKDPKRLECEVLPKYFRHSRFQSLVRQLNFYNFKKVSKERHAWIYHHELFHRDQPLLLDGLKRKTNNIAESQSFKHTAPYASMPPKKSSFIETPGSVWRQVYDPSTGHVYYWNTVTDHIQWDQPPDHKYHQHHPNYRVDHQRGNSFGSFDAVSDTSSEADSWGYQHVISQRTFSTSSEEATEGPFCKRRRVFESVSDTDDDVESTTTDDFTEDDMESSKGLNVPKDSLTSLQRSLYESHMSPALVALITFSLRTSPYQKPRVLLASFREKLNSHNELRNELRRYGEAMEPKTECLHQHVSHMYMEQVLCDARGPHSCKNEACEMREFLGFMVTRLQMVHDTTYLQLDREQQKILDKSLRLWWNHASRYI
mmetsp:Transcript_12896/g.15404  ORF Transcript_12896/g.15404 Transcript_12896/m.15404 type:complete len:434 (-) Transcript_12896:197-1498(-)